MKLIEINVHTAEWQEPRQIKLDEAATVAELVDIIKAAGAAIGEPGEEVILLVENKEVTCHKHQKLHECGIGHGHHVHFFEIVVNTRHEWWKKREISYAEVVKLAFPNQSQDPKDVYSVTFSKGPEHRREGTLAPGESTKVKCGMIFNVKHTYRS